MNARLDGKNESTSRLVTTHRARAPSSRPLSPFHRARRASRDRIDDRGTESTTEGLNESTIARANHTECDDFHAEPVHRPPHTFASLETFVRSRHHRGRRGRRGPSSRSPARVVIHFIRMACMRARRSTWGGYTTSHDPSIPLFVSFSSPNDQKKKVQHPRSKRTGYTRVMTHHRERDTYKKSHARGPMQSRSRGKKKQNTKHPRPGVRCVCGLDDGS